MSRVHTVQNWISTECGPINTPSHLLFIKLGRGLGGRLKMGREWASWGRGLSNVCFQYVANHSLSFVCLV